MMSALMLASAFGIAIVSAVCPLVNLEVYMAGVGAFGEDVGFWPVVLMAAFGQATGKLLWYQIGRSSMHWNFIQKKTQSPRWKRQFDRVKSQTERRPWMGTGLVFMSASVGLPPLAIMSVLTGQLHFNRLLFFATTVAGRSLRFAMVLGGAAWLAHAGVERWTL